MGRRALLVIAAMLVAAFGTGMIWLYVNGLQDEARNHAKTVQVLVAKADLKKGAKADDLRPGTDFEPIPVAKDVAGGNYILGSDLNAFKGRVLLDNIPQGLPLQSTMFGDPSSTKGVIETGKYGVQIALGDPMRVTGLLQPGSKVTIFKNQTVGARTTTSVLLSDVTVVTTNGFSPVPGQDGAVPKTLVTFLLTPTDTAKLIHTQSKGVGAELWLALQGDGPAPSPAPTVTTDNLISGAQ